jgi:hypothetical protein
MEQLLTIQEDEKFLTKKKQRDSNDSSIDMDYVMTRRKQRTEETPVIMMDIDETIRKPAKKKIDHLKRCKPNVVQDIFSYLTLQEVKSFHNGIKNKRLKKHSLAVVNM